MAQIQNQIDRTNGLVKENLKDMPQTSQRLVSEAREMGSQGLDYIKDSFGDLQTSAKKALDKTTGLVSENPYYFIAGAAVVGVIAGALLARSRK